MALYVLDINESGKHGKAMKKMRQSDAAARLIPMDECEEWSRRHTENLYH